MRKKSKNKYERLSDKLRSNLELTADERLEMAMHIESLEFIMSNLKDCYRVYEEQKGNLKE